MYMIMNSCAKKRINERKDLKLNQSCKQQVPTTTMRPILPTTSATTIIVPEQT